MESVLYCTLRGGLGSVLLRTVRGIEFPLVVAQSKGALIIRLKK